MAAITTVVIGAGQAGLAMSRCLSALGVDHVVLERGSVAQRWRSQSWDSLRLLTPNWMTRLPGFQYDGADPHGFMPVSDVIGMLERYAAAMDAPIETGTPVRRVEQEAGGFRVVSDRVEWHAASVVVATGYCDRPAIPAMSCRLSPSIEQLAPVDYRRPGQLVDGGVLVVGASSTGVQLADEIQRSGRQVTLAAGRHTRLPRHYRGHDILWWLDRLGVLSQHADTVAAIEISRRQPSLQLVGSEGHVSLDLLALREQGVRLTGRVTGIRGYSIDVADDLIANTAAADIKMAEILARIDGFIAEHRLSVPPAGPFRPTWTLALDGPSGLDLKAEGIRTVIWATGYRRAYPWLHVPVLDARGEILHRRGVTPARGMYVLGMNFQQRRNSSFLDGVGADAWAIAHQIARSHARAIA